MNLWVGKPAKHDSPSVLFASATAQPGSVPHALHHIGDGGLFKSPSDNDADFACDGCGRTVGLRVTDGMDITATALAEAFGRTAAEAQRSGDAVGLDADEVRPGNDS